MANKQEEQSLVSVSPTPVELLRMAVEKGTDLDQLKQLMDLQERWEKNEARKAFVVALNEFKKSPPTIRKNKHVSFGQTNYDHATLDHVCDAVTEGLSTHGLSHRWRVEQEAGSIKVTCIITHEMGHSEETTLIGGADTSGSKNSIQAIGSTVTYLQRYTLLAATGLAAANQDNDGAGPGVESEWLTEQLAELSRCETTEGLKAAFTMASTIALDAKDMGAYTKLKEAKDKRKAELA